MDLMIDFETWGTAPNAVIRAAALAEFFPSTGKVHRTLLIDARYSVDNQIEHGRTMDNQTVQWWLDREETLNESMRGMSVRFAHNLAMLSSMLDGFIHRIGYERAWSRGRFDLPILATLTNIPWEFWREADVRTLDFIVPKPRPDQPHNPLSDVQAQIRQVHAAYLQRAPDASWPDAA